MGQEVFLVFNLNNKKKRIIAAVIIGLLIVAMILPMVASVLG